MCAAGSRLYAHQSVFDRLVEGVAQEAGKLKIGPGLNPDTLTRTLAPQATTTDGQGDRTEALRLVAPAVETWKFDAEIDATDQLEAQDAMATQYGVAPQLAALETLIYPASATLHNNYELSQHGTLEIMPVMAPYSVA